MMKKKTKVFWLTAAALVFLTGAAVPPAMAYFTTYVEAEGGYSITLGNETTIEEKVRKYQLNTLKYTDNLQNFKNTEILKPGDSLEVGQSTRYQITTVDNSNNLIVVKMTSGTESIPAGTDVLRVLV